MSNTTTEINWHNTLPQNLEGHKCIAVTKTGETIEGILEYRTAQPDMYVRIDSLHFPGVKPWVIVNQCEYLLVSRPLLLPKKADRAF